MVSKKSDSRIVGRRTVLTAGVLALLSASAQAAVITVGSGVSCTRPTIQSAIDYARSLGGSSTIRVSGNGDPNKVWLENLVVNDTPVEIVGGYATCTSEIPSGRTTLSGSRNPVPALRISGDRNVSLRNLNVRDGSRDPPTSVSGGIEYVGRGALVLEDTSVSNNHGGGIDINGAGGQAVLELRGAVAVSANEGFGIRAQFAVDVRASFGVTEISGNQGNGIVIGGASTLNLSGAGGAIAGNHGYGLYVLGSGFHSGRVSHLESSDPTRPLHLTGNGYGAIRLASEDSQTWLCTRNLRIDDNGSATSTEPTIRVSGSARLEMNTPCDWATPIPLCPVGPGRCNSITGNRTAGGFPLFSAEDGGAVVADRLCIESNAVASIVSTNPASPSAASVVITNTAIVDNPLRDTVFDARQNAHVQIRASTIIGGTGGPSFRASAPGALIVRDTIVARSEPLVATDTPSRSVLTNILSPHRLGTGPNDTIVEGAVRLRPNSVCLQPGALGVDHAGAEVLPLDIYGGPRQVDDPEVLNIGGARDIGACEDTMPSVDVIFRGSFD